MTEFLTKKERKRVESFLKIGEDVILGSVKIDHDLCKGCKFCAKSCPAAVLEIIEKKCRMVEILPMCMSCGCCVAICPENAINMVSFIEFKYFFRYLDRGTPELPRQF